MVEFAARIVVFEDDTAFEKDIEAAGSRDQADEVESDPIPAWNEREKYPFLSAIEIVRQ
ncbi:MAG: hypothetical protein AAF517_20965 [Planctomycetota bacterium]